MATAHPDVQVESHDYDRAWPALPLRVVDGHEERLLGGLTVRFLGPRNLAHEAVAFLQTFVDRCAQALARTRLVEAVRRAADAAPLLERPLPHE